jgi:hypothetical protein
LQEWASSGIFAYQRLIRQYYSGNLMYKKVNLVEKLSEFTPKATSI